MGQEIKTICLTLPFSIGSVNCYLIDTGEGFILVDTGSAQNYAVLSQELEAAGCKPGAIRLIILTHGDFDHTGCAAQLADKYAAKIAMHPADWGMLERGDMFANRKNASGPLRVIAPLLFGFGKAQKRPGALGVRLWRARGGAAAPGQRETRAVFRQRPGTRGAIGQKREAGFRLSGAGRGGGQEQKRRALRRAILRATRQRRAKPRARRSHLAPRQMRLRYRQ